MNYDLIIIGSGPGGYRTAEYAARQGMQVLIVEADQAGGTCLNCGCIPTKAFCHDAELAAQGLPLDFASVVERKNTIVEQLRTGVETLMQSPGITMIYGKASFKDTCTIEVATPSSPTTLYTAPNIIIATGSHAKMLPIEGINLPHVMTSTELLNINHVPARLCIIGAGVIGMEFACVFASFGSEVTVVEFLKECLPTMDSDIAKRLRKQMEKRGVKFYLQAGVKSITEQGVSFERKGKEETVEADAVLVATGRAANVEGLNLEAAGIEVSRQGIVVDPDTFLAHSSLNTHIYAIGDVNGRQMLAHAATFQGYRAVNHILGKTDGIRFGIMPAAVFTNPEAASVGPTEDQLKNEGKEFSTHKGYYRANGKALTMNATEGLVKLLTDSEERIIGCHILGAHAADLVQEIAALMNRDATLTQLRETIHIHPTLSEILQDL